MENLWISIIEGTVYSGLRGSIVGTGLGTIAYVLTEKMFRKKTMFFRYIRGMNRTLSKRYILLHP